MYEVTPIGTIRTPFCEQAGTPIQPGYGDEAHGEAVLDPAFAAGLADLERFERAWLVTWLHKSGDYKLRVVPYRDTRERGLFATRAPRRPNPIGISCVRVLGVEGNVLRFAGADMLDGTPLLDIKPYSPRFDAFPDARAGWLDDEAVDRRRADGRFDEGPSGA